MARFIFSLAVVLILIAQAATSRAGDVFTGFQMDNKSQYFTYLGVRTPFLKSSAGSDLFVQAMTAGLGYSFKTNGQLLGCQRPVHCSVTRHHHESRLDAVALASRQTAPNQDQRLNASSTTTYQAGFYGRLEAFYWQEKWNLHAIGSYADLDNFFWSRLRGKVLAYKPEKSCCATYVGWDVTEWVMPISERS